MADSSGRLISFLVEGEDVVSCEVCMEAFDPLKRPPKLLPCGHNFCESCLFTMCCHQQYYFLDSISCPTCRAAFETKVAKSAPTNYDLCKVLESVQRGMEMANFANVTVIHVASQPEKELSPPLKQLAQKTCALRHKKCSDCRRKLPSKTLMKTSRFCELCNTLDTMKFTCLECCINRHNGHTLLTIRELESNQLKAVHELRDARRRIVEASEAFDGRLAQIGLHGHAASLVSQKQALLEEILRCNEETMQRVEAARLVSGAGLRNIRSEQVHNLSRLANLSSVLEKTVVVEKKHQETKPLTESDYAKRQSRLTLRSDDSLAREALSNLLAVLPSNSKAHTLSLLVAEISPRDTVDDRKLIYFNCAKTITEILNSGLRLEEIIFLIADALLNCFYQLNILSKKKNEKSKVNRQAIWKLIQYAYSLVMELVAKVYPAYHPERVNILDDVAFLCHLYSDVCDQATVALLIIEAARARSAEGHLSPMDQKRTEERLQLVDDHLLELRRIQRLNDLKSKTTTRASGRGRPFWRKLFPTLSF